MDCSPTSLLPDVSREHTRLPPHGGAPADQVPRLPALAAPPPPRTRPERLATPGRVPAGTRCFRQEARPRGAQARVCVEGPPTHTARRGGGGRPAGPGANREAVFLLAGTQAPCVWLRTDTASDEEPGASESARGGRTELPTSPPWPGQPFLGGCPGALPLGGGTGRAGGLGRLRRQNHRRPLAALVPIPWAHHTPARGRHARPPPPLPGQAFGAHRPSDKTNIRSPRGPLQGTHDLSHGPYPPRGPGCPSLHLHSLS